MTLTRLAHAPELLDDPAHEPAVLQHSLEHVAQINRFLGGRSAVLHAIAPLLRAGRNIRILDVGTGSADIPRAVVDAARARGAVTEVIATDLHPQMREIAERECAGYPEISIENANALALPYSDASFDVVLLSLTLHHFEDEDPVTAVREAARVGGLVVVNELERGRMNYIGARLLAATWWRRNVLTRHDGPLSVLRAFSAAELRAIGAAAGLRDLRVSRRWFFRIVMTGHA